VAPREWERLTPASPRSQAQRAGARYGVLATVYDVLELGFFSGLRAEAVAALDLRMGESALDMGCGTGLSHPHLRRAVGPSGRVVGVDVSAAMLGRARRRVVLGGWNNVHLVHADGARMPLAASSFDAALCFYTHDLMTMREAMEGILHALKPDGRLVAAGAKRAGGIVGGALSLALGVVSIPFATRWRHLREPWAELAALLPIQVADRLRGTAYLAVGKKT
jgi:ubiquinone/menaquinone biosynthesis C-methylase UbiE